MKKLMVTVCALAMLTACAKNHSGGDSSSTGGAVGALNEELSSKMVNTVHFDFDKANVSDNAKHILKAQAELMKKHNSTAFVIEGHADQRGTTEYNLALGEKRANAVKEFLAHEEGIKNQIVVTSFGKEKLADQGTTEEAYAKNRRAVTVAVQN